MKNKAILFIVMSLFVLFAVSTVMAGVDIEEVSINGIELGPSEATEVAGFPEETMPILVRYFAENVDSNFKIKVWIEGYKSDIYASSDRLYTEGTRTERFSITLPEVEDMDDLYEDLTLYVKAFDKDETLDEEEYHIILQREAYAVDVLSIETPQELTAGSVVGIDVVLKNRGQEELEDVYVTARIPDLGVERRVYFGDIDELDEEDFECEADANYCRDLNREDAMERKIYLTIPTGIQSGIYSLEVKASNYDFSETVKKNVLITSGKSDILSPATSKDVTIGETVSFDVVVVNSGERMALYSITAEDVKGLIISVDESVISVPADSSRTVRINVKATDSVDQGTHTINVDVQSGGELVKSVGFSANVEKASGVSNTILGLTVILVIVFLVLLVILIVLLTKKPVATEELGETSYY